MTNRCPICNCPAGAHTTYYGSKDRKLCNGERISVINDESSERNGSTEGIELPNSSGRSPASNSIGCGGTERASLVNGESK